MQIPTLFGRLVYLASLRDAASGLYQHEVLNTLMNPEDSDRALSRGHRRLFSEWLARGIAEQRRDLDEYLRTAGAPRNFHQYRTLVPPTARDVRAAVVPHRSGDVDGIASLRTPRRRLGQALDRKVRKQFGPPMNAEKPVFFLSVFICTTTCQILRGPRRSYVGQVFNLRRVFNPPGERSSPARETIRPPAARNIPRGWVAALLLCVHRRPIMLFLPAAPPGAVGTVVREPIPGGCRSPSRFRPFATALHDRVGDRKVRSRGNASPGGRPDSGTEAEFWGRIASR